MAARDRFGHFLRGQATAKAAPEPAAPAEARESTELVELAQAEARLGALDSERAAIAGELEQHATARQLWLDRGGSLESAAGLGEQDETLRQRLGEIERERMDVAARAALLTAEVHTVEWQAWQERLLALEVAACDCLDGYKARLRELARERHQAAGAGFGTEVHRECTAPPAAAHVLHPYAAGEFVRAVRLRQARREGQAPAPAVPATPEQPAQWWWSSPPPKPFVPHPPPSGVEIESLSPFARRWIRVLHDCDASRISIGYDRLTAGMVMCLPHRRAVLLVVQGFAEYCEAPEPAEPMAATETAA